VDTKWINAFLGTDIPKEDMKDYMNRLDMETELSGDNLVITVPTFRGDIKIKEDISEEVARIFGYEKIPMTIINSVNTRGGKNRRQRLNDKTVEAMLCSGLNQSISYTFVSPKCYDKILRSKDDSMRKAVVIRNPLGEDYSIMRTSTLPSMMECLARNYNRSNEYAALFEIGKVYIPGEDLDKLPDENNLVTIGLYGGVDFFHLKGAVENLVEALGIKDYEFRRESENPSFHPGKTAVLYVGGEYAGVLGEMHPGVNDNFGIEERCYIAELNLDVMYKYADEGREYKPLPKFPAVLRDIAMLLDDSVMAKDIEAVITKVGGEMVESAKLFDVYKGEQIPEGKKSVAYSISYRLDYKTLTDDEVEEVHDRIVKSLKETLGAELR